MFNDLCQNVLKLIGNRIVSLRITLTNVIDGWSLVSSSLKYYQTTLLQRLHLIDITPHEFDNILCNPLIKRLRTLLVDVTPCNPFHYLEIEGVYLTKVCSQIPCLTNCRLPFNVYHKNLYKLNKYSVVPIMSLPNLLNTTHLRTLTIVPWSLLTKISIDEGDVVTTGELESILRMAYNVHTLVIRDDRGVFSHAILHNIDNLGTRVNQQIQTLEIDDMTLTLKNIQYFGRLLSNQLANLKKVLFKIYDSCDGWKWIPSRIIDGENESTKRIVNVIYFLIDHLQQLVLLHIDFISFNYLESPCFPHLIQHQLNQYPINRPYRLRCLAERIEICL
ncbi:unnamed protein product [Rotaria sp. Silwood1]|nr:unnamed protein product [Rotaria sp. Silwood1]CAF1684185.1 unnamed protein product [Rotaria sp. Silwood1]